MEFLDEFFHSFALFEGGINSFLCGVGSAHCWRLYVTCFCVLLRGLFLCDLWVVVSLTFTPISFYFYLFHCVLKKIPYLECVNGFDVVFTGFEIYWAERPVWTLAIMLRSSSVIDVVRPLTCYILIFFLRATVPNNVVRQVGEILQIISRQSGSK